MKKKSEKSGFSLTLFQVYIYRNYIVMRSSGLDYDWTLLLLVREVYFECFLLYWNVCVLFSQNVITHRM